MALPPQPKRNVTTNQPKRVPNVVEFLHYQLKNLHRQAFSEETAAAAGGQQQQQKQPQTQQNNGGDVQVGQIGTGTADNIAFWVPPAVAGRTSRRHRGMLHGMSFDCGSIGLQLPPVAVAAPPVSMTMSVNNGNVANPQPTTPNTQPQSPQTNDQPPLTTPDGSEPTAGLSWSSVTPASMDLFKKFTEKTVEVKNLILGNEALSSITSAVANTAGNIVNNTTNLASPSADSPNNGALQQQPLGGSNQSSNNGSYTNHNTIGYNPDGTSSGEPPPVVIPSLPISASFKKGHASMHQAIDFRKINTNLYDGEKKRMPTVQQANVEVDSADDEVGTIRLIFEHQRANGIFVVTVDKVSGLPAPGDGSALDPFCHVQLLPDKRVIATKVLRGSLNPDFHEQIMFDVADEDDLPNRILELTVAHRDQSATGQVVGWLRLAMNSFDLTANPGPMEVYRPLLSPDKKEGTKIIGGNLLISVSYLATAKRLTVYVHEAKGLRFADEIGTGTASSIDASVRVALVIDGKKSKKKKTATQHGANVVWNEAITYTDIAAETITSGRLQAIDIEVAHETLLGDKPLGHVLVSPTAAVASAQAHWQAMRQGDDTPRWHRLRFTN